MDSSLHLKSSINIAKSNIITLPFPLKVLSQGAALNAAENASERNKKRMVIFLGSDFHNLPGADLGRTAKLTNQCLDYIRRECPGRDLFYKPHPNEINEHAMLNLEGFSMMDTMPVEVSYIKYAERIDHIFSICSTASRIAHDFGFNSSVFLELATSAFDSQTMNRFRDFLALLPHECFINDFAQSLRENRTNTDSSKEIELQIKQLVAGRRGTVWVLIGDPNSLPYARVIDGLVKRLSSAMVVHLVISQHHRWEAGAIDVAKHLFDNVSFIPRIFYSLRPHKLLQAWRAARLIRTWPVGDDDVIISRLGLAFTDNCFVSYFPNTTSVALMPEDFFELACGEQTISTDGYRRRLGATVFNSILEPLLGIERTEYFENKQRSGWNIYRYDRPLNDIFDFVWVYNG